MKINVIDETDYQLNAERKRREMRNRKLMIIKQKLMGVALACIGVIAPLLLDGDATASVFLLPAGLYMVLNNTIIK